MKNLTILYLLMLTSITFAQETNLEWAKHYEGSGNSSSREIKLDSYENSIIVGSINGEVDFDPTDGTFFLESTEGHAAFIHKNNSNGELLWAKTIEGTSQSGFYDVAIDSDNNIILAGYFKGTVDLDMGLGEHFSSHLSPLGYTNFLMKLSADGEYLWSKEFSHNKYDTGIFDESSFLSISTNEADIYLTGYFQDTLSFGTGIEATIWTSEGDIDCFLIKMNSEGDILDSHHLGTATYDDFRVAVHDDKLYLFGNTSSDFDFDLKDGIYNVGNANSFGGFIAKYDLGLNLEWVNMYEDHNTFVTHITFDYLNNPIIAGYFFYRIDFDFGEGEDAIDGVESFSLFTHKLSSEGASIWSLTYVSDFSFNRVYDIDNDGLNTYMTMSFTDELDIDPLGDVEAIIYGSYNNKAIVKLNFDGGLLWGAALDSNLTQHVAKFELTSEQDIIGIGNFIATIDADLESTEVLLTATSTDHYLFKMNTSETVNITTNQSNIAINIYPNPTVNELTIQSTEPIQSVAIYNLNGQVIISSIDTQLDVSILSSGVYIITIKTESGISKQKFTKL